MRILYIIGKLLTFPGAYIKAFWEHLVCNRNGIAVQRATYLALDEGCGHIEHDVLQGRRQLFRLCFLPGLYNALLGLPLFFAGSIGLLYFGVTLSNSLIMFVLYCIMLYLGFSLLANLAPFYEDALLLWELSFEEPLSGGKRALVFLPELLMRITAFLEKYSLQLLLLLGLLIAMALL